MNHLEFLDFQGSQGLPEAGWLLQQTSCCQPTQLNFQLQLRQIRPELVSLGTSPVRRHTYTSLRARANLSLETAEKAVYVKPNMLEKWYS